MSLAILNALGVVAGFGGTLLLYLFGSPFRQRTGGVLGLALEQEDEPRKVAEGRWNLASYTGVALIAVGAAILIYVGFQSL